MTKSVFDRIDDLTARIEQLKSNLDGIAGELGAFKEALAPLRAVTGEAVAGQAAPRGRKRGKAKASTPSSKKKANPALVRQGQYLGYLRHASKKDRAEMQRIQKTKGTAAAISYAKSRKKG